MRFENFVVNRFMLGKIGLTWETIDDEGLYNILLQRSESLEGPFENLNNIPFKNVYGYIDTTTNRDNIYRIFYYRLCAIHKLTNQEIYSEVKATVDNDNTWIGKSIAKQERLLLRRFVGDKTLLFIRKTFGARCPNCYDKVRGKIIFENCESCYGTSFLGGFFSPIHIDVQYNVLPKGYTRTELGIVAPKASVAWTSNYPIVKPGDILVNLEDSNRYLIDSVPKITKDKRGPVRQIMQIIKIDNSNILNKIPVILEAPSIDDVNVFRRG